MFNKAHHHYFSRESCLSFIIVYILCFNQLASTLDVNDIVFVILSQPDKYHSTIAEHLRQDILGQVSSIQNSSCNIRLVHEEFPHLGAWTVTPLLPWLHGVHGSNSLWVLFLQERTQVNIKTLLTALKQYETEQEIWMGHLLHDEESTIIHHFAFSDNPSRFKYPLFTSGFVMSMDLIKSLVKKNTNKNINKDFSIDAAHEFALYVGKPLLNASDVFCLKKSSNCATYLTDIKSCGKPVPNENIFFAVKTCRKFHEERIPIIKKTWGKHAKNIEFFSHYQDKNIPTTDVGVENTERGHCTKMFAIFRLVLERAKLLPDLQWLLLADDDTLLSVPRLQELLACWNSSEPMAVGERYGYNVLDSKSGGYNYLTGGGGIAITMSALPSILQHCSCYQNDAPDDMYLGICLARLNIPMIHSSNFHQARPNDYSAGYLAAHKPVSFHKHWMINPLKTYKKWFEQADNIHRHTEL